MVDKRNDVLEEIRLKMKNDPWHIKLKIWINLQWWLFYCLLT